MIYFASDMHAECRDALEEYEKIATENDLLIILGDLYIKCENTEENRSFTDFFFSLKSNIAFIEGNHDNHPFINSHPEEEWNGGLVHRLSPNAVHLIRGNVYEIEGLNFLVMGGCKSSPRWKEMGLWFDGEEPTAEEINLAYKNLSEKKIDVILTHKYETAKTENAPHDSLDGFIHYLKNNPAYKLWISGHWHEERRFSEKCVCVYDKLRTLEELL